MPLPPDQGRDERKLTGSSCGTKTKGRLVLIYIHFAGFEGVCKILYDKYMPTSAEVRIFRHWKRFCENVFLWKSLKFLHLSKKSGKNCERHCHVALTICSVPEGTFLLCFPRWIHHSQARYPGFRCQQVSRLSEQKLSHLTKGICSQRQHVTSWTWLCEMTPTQSAFRVEVHVAKLGCAADCKTSKTYPLETIIPILGMFSFLIPKNSSFYFVFTTGYTFQRILDENRGKWP